MKHGQLRHTEKACSATLVIHFVTRRRENPNPWSRHRRFLKEGSINYHHFVLSGAAPSRLGPALGPRRPGLLNKPALRLHLAPEKFHVHTLKCYGAALSLYNPNTLITHTPKGGGLLPKGGGLRPTVCCSASTWTTWTVNFRGKPERTEEARCRENVEKCANISYPSHC